MSAPTVTLPVATGPTGAEILVNTTTENDQIIPGITALSNGGFVVVWQDQSGNQANIGATTPYSIMAQVFAADGTPIGAERLVNTATQGNQFGAQATALPNGTFVVTWTDASGGAGGGAGDDTSGNAIKAQIFAADGSPVGTEIPVNTATQGSQSSAHTTVLSNGGFVVTWQDASAGVGGADGDTSGTAIKAQVFNADGTRIGTELLVNTATQGGQFGPQSTALSNGGFVVTWQDLSLGVGGTSGDSSDAATKAQLFAADGTPVGAEILVNTATQGSQLFAKITALSEGGIVVVWQDASAGVGGASGDTSGTAVKAQVYAADGSANGPELLVNTTTSSGQSAPQITALVNGGFVITWQDASASAGDSNGLAIRSQVFDANGSKLGTEILVNTATQGNQSKPQITALEGGGFVITWEDFSAGVGGASGDTSSSSVKAQLFAPNGSPIGTEFLVNTGTNGPQTVPQIAALSNGGFAIAWQDLAGSAADGSSHGIKAQVFGPPRIALEQVDLTLKNTGIHIADADAADIQTVTLSTAYGVLTATAGSSGATVAGSGTSALTLTGTAAQVEALLNTDASSTIRFTANTDTPPASTLVTISVNDGTTTVSANLTLSIAAVNDAPSAAGLPTDVTVAQGVASNLDLSSATLADADTSGAISVVVTASAGTMAAASGGGVTVSNSGTGALTLTGTAAAIDTFLNTASNIQYTGPAGVSGNDAATLTVTANDGTGAVALGTINIDITPADTTRPTATIFVADTALKVGETSVVTVTFSEAVSGFDNTDLTVANGTLSAVSSADGGITWTGTFTPTTGITDATNVITLANTGVADLAGNAGTGTTSSNTYTIDTSRPTATIVVADTSLTLGETSLVTVTFSEAVTGFDNTDLTVANGTLSAVSSADGGITWTGTFTPTTNITDATNVITLANTGVADLAGNAGTGTTSSNTYTIDTSRPTATIVVADTSLTLGETSLVTVSFSEAVTGFDDTDLTVENGRLSGISSDDGGVTWTATLTPTASISDTSNVIILANTGIADMAGNAGTGTTPSNAYAIDTTRPTGTIVVADTALRVGETSGVTLTFSEAVTGLDASDLTVENGMLSDISSADGGVTWTAILTPTASITDASNLITLANTGVTDLAGNFGTGTILSNPYAIDTTRPTAAIVVADTSLTAGEISAVTITFSEAVTGFDNNDLTVANGTLSAVSSADGGITWTATLTPTADVTDTTNLITLANAGVLDLAANAGSGTTSSNNYTINTVAAPPPPLPPPPPPPPAPADPTQNSDVIVVSDTGATVSALGGDDQVSGGRANDVIRGDAGADTLFGANGDDTLHGGTDNDVLQGNAGNDRIFGDPGDDIARGGQGDDQIQGNGGSDTLFGDIGDDTVLGGQGSDLVQGNAGQDLIFGDLGDDTVLGGQGNDLVQGNGGNDLIFGDLGDDTLRGGQGDDQLFGGAGNDFLSGDLGNDTLSGGAGTDLFYFFAGAGRDVVLDFNPLEGDRVLLDPGATYTVTRVGNDTILTLPGGDSIVLVDFQNPTLGEGWIIGA
jgi:Ca2+-binding RTX toxin-like protein